MASPFPGMSPYLENPLFWSEIHNLLIAAIFRKLNPQLCPKYKVAIEKRVYQTDEGNYDLVMDYTQEPLPPLSKQNAVWVDEVLVELGLR